MTAAPESSRRARHSAPVNRRAELLSVLPLGRVGAKSIAGVGLVAALGAGTVVGSGATAATAEGSGAARVVAAGDRTQGASRAAARVPAMAVVAPKTSKTPVKYNDASFGAVAKPKPKPKPVVKADATTGTSSGDSSSRSSGSSARTSSSSTSSSATNVGSGTLSGSAGMGKCSGKGLVPAAQQVCAIAIANFPGVQSVGGIRPGDGGDHGTGHAADIMVPVSSATGDAVAAYMIAHASSLDIKYVIWKQRIWLPGSGWRGMSDRGSITQNHFDHVHVSVN